MTFYDESLLLEFTDMKTKQKHITRPPMRSRAVESSDTSVDIRKQLGHANARGQV